VHVENYRQLDGWDVSRNRFVDVGSASLGTSFQCGMMLGFQSWLSTRPSGVRDLRFNGNQFIDTAGTHKLSAALLSPAGAVRVDTGCSTNSTTTVVDANALITDIGSLITGTNITAGAIVTNITGSVDGYTGTGYTISIAATGTGSGITFTLTKQPPTFENVEVFDTNIRLADAAVIAATSLQTGQNVAQAQRALVVHKTSDQSTSDGVNLSDVTELAWPVIANATYAFEFEILVLSSVATTGIALSMNGPSTPTYVRYTRFDAVSGGAMNAGGATAYNVALVDTAGSTANPLPAIVRGYLVNGTNTGTLTLRFRSEVDTTSITIQRGSWGRLTRIV
jgi:hypothetical protein